MSGGGQGGRLHQMQDWCICFGCRLLVVFGGQCRLADVQYSYRTNRPESSVTEASGMKDGRPWTWAIYVPAAGRPSITTELRRRLNFSTPFWT